MVGKRRLRTVVAALVAVAAVAGQAAAPAGAAPGSPVSATGVTWRPCDRGFECATVPVPLDYAHPARAGIGIALIRHRATDQAHRIGSVFFNPGGPGGSGVAALPLVYAEFPPRVRARFDVVGFDPRGIGASAALQCFDTNADEEQYLAGLPLVPVAPAEQRAWVDRYAGFDAHCGQRAGALPDHDTTADVARDMDRLRGAVGDRALSYLGISYGSYLGATYANLFPQRVRAMVLDGNVDAVAWNRPDPLLGTFQRLGSDVASAHTIATFLDLCGAAGPARCPFAAGGPAATRAKYRTLLERLRTRPVLVGAPPKAVAVTRELASSVVVSGMYYARPLPGTGEGWRAVAVFLQGLWTGSGPKQLTLPKFGLDRLAAEPYDGREGQLGVVCSDSPNPRNPAVYPLASAVGQRRAGAPSYGWLWPFEACAQWPAHARPYTGPWNHPTAHPLLLVGNTVDPATPYQGSVALQRELADARLLTVDGYGHTSLVNPSACALAAQDRYLVDGVLPAPGTRCRQDAPPF